MPHLSRRTTIAGRHQVPAPAALALTALALAALALLVAPVAAGLPAPTPALAAAVTTSSTDAPVGGPRLADNGAVTFDLPPGVPKPPRMPAKSYLLADLSTGQILVAKDPHRRLRPASTLKILTALTLLPRLDEHHIYTARTADEVVDGTRVGIVAGSTYSVHQLFQGLLMTSGNDAANALANAAGGVPRTVDLMQQEAAHLGARDTTVGDPSGLDSPGQRTSTYDLALFARAAMQRKDFRDFVTTRTAKFPGMILPRKDGQPAAHVKRSKSFEIQNHNTLLTAYRGAIGVKPGYTEKARWTYVGAARRGAHTYLVSELSLNQQGWRPTMKLLDWAFAHGRTATPIGHLVTPAELNSLAAESKSGSTTPTSALGAGAGATELADAGGSRARSRAARWIGAGDSPPQSSSSPGSASARPGAAGCASRGAGRPTPRRRPRV